jgi:hypothetical protein
VAQELDQAEQFVHPLADLAARGAGLLDLEAEGDVLADGHVPEEGVMLEDEADPAPLDGEVGGVLAGQLDVARVGLLQAGDDPQDRALARPGRAEQGHELAGGDLERDPVDDLELAEPLR